MGKEFPTSEFMRWLISHKWELTFPVPMKSLYNEFPGEKPTFDYKFLNKVKQMCYKEQSRSEFSIPQIAHVLFLLSIPVNDKLEKLMRDVGELRLDRGCRIEYFYNGSCLWEGEHRPWRGKKIQIKNEYEEMATVEEEETEAQKSQKVLEEKFQFRHDVDVAIYERSQEMLDRNAHMPDEPVQYLSLHVPKIENFHLPDKHFQNLALRVPKNKDFHMPIAGSQEPALIFDVEEKPDLGTNKNKNNSMDINIELDVFVPNLENAPAPRQQLIAPITPTAPVYVQPPVTAISGTQFFKALKKIAIVCELDDVLAAINDTEEKVQNQNISIPIMNIVVKMSCIVYDIQNCPRQNERPTGEATAADLYLLALNSAVLTIGSMEPVIELIEKTRTKNVYISRAKIHDHFRNLFEVVGKQV